ncbi:MAG TPA: hypothetical protein VEI01_25100 [Terriglobales bacterium]|nr:hypothetical protein [Terriglobales bacterium]
MAWTSDSQAVLFWSDRNGPNQIFKQKTDQQTAETMVAGADQPWMPRVTPDGRSILYSYLPEGPGSISTRIIAPQPVMDVPRLGNYACPRVPADVCFMRQLSEDGKKVVVSAVDPLQGKTHSLRVDVHPGALFNWMPSPDGSRIVFVEFSTLERRVRLLSLKGEPERDIVVKGWAGFNSIDWQRMASRS